MLIFAHFKTRLFRVAGTLQHPATFVLRVFQSHKRLTLEIAATASTSLSD